MRPPIEERARQQKKFRRDKFRGCRLTESARVPVDEGAACANFTEPVSVGYFRAAPDACVRVELDDNVRAIVERYLEVSLRPFSCQNCLEARFVWNEESLRFRIVSSELLR